MTFKFLYFALRNAEKQVNSTKAKSMRYTAATFLVFFLVFFFSSFKTLNPSTASVVKTVVIDAGHGGHDAGCQYGGAKEKDVTLAIALQLGKIISENLKDVKVVYTRTD